MHKNDFGSNAYPDVQAAINYVRSQNDKPIVLHGFCFGGAMALHATLMEKKNAAKEGRPAIIADAIGLSCMFTEFENLFDRAFTIEDRWFYWFLMKSGLGSTVLDFMMNGSLFDLLPVEMVKELGIPCWFDHAKKDPFAIMEEASQVYDAVPNAKWFFKSDLGRHVRIHSKVPHQYRVAYNGFLKNIGFLTDDSNVHEDVSISKIALTDQEIVVASAVAAHSA